MSGASFNQRVSDGRMASRSDGVFPAHQMSLKTPDALGTGQVYSQVNPQDLSVASSYASLGQGSSATATPFVNPPMSVHQHRHNPPPRYQNPGSRFQLASVANKNVLRPLQSSHILPKQSVPGTIFVPHQQLPPALHNASNATGLTSGQAALSSGATPARCPLPAHQPSSTPQGMSSSTTNSRPLQHPLLVPNSQAQSTFVVTGNQMIGQPIVATSGTVFVAVPTTTLVTRPTNHTGSSASTATSPVHPHAVMIPQQVVRLSPRGTTRPAQLTFVQRGQSTAVHQRLAPPMLRAQIMPARQPPPAHNQPASLPSFAMIQLANPSSARYAVPLKIVPTTSVQQVGSVYSAPLEPKPTEPISMSAAPSILPSLTTTSSSARTGLNNPVMALVTQREAAHKQAIGLNTAPHVQSALNTQTGTLYSHSALSTQTGVPYSHNSSNTQTGVPYSQSVSSAQTAISYSLSAPSSQTGSPSFHGAVNAQTSTPYSYSASSTQTGMSYSHNALSTQTGIPYNHNASSAQTAVSYSGSSTEVGTPLFHGASSTQSDTPYSLNASSTQSDTPYSLSAMSTQPGSPNGHSALSTQTATSYSHAASNTHTDIVENRPERSTLDSIIHEGALGRQAAPPSGPGSMVGNEQDIGLMAVAHTKGEPSLTSDETDVKEPVFVWDEYLEETGSVAAPPTSFKHVETSLKNGFTKGMKLEVPNKCRPDTYWIATVMMSCGPLLRLRYDGYGDDNNDDFWCDVQTSDIHKIGWCGLNGKILQPPESIVSKHESWHQFLVETLEEAVTAPDYLLDKATGSAPIDQIREGMRVVVQHELQPLSVWVARIIQNVGGRLHLRWEGTEKAQHDFWLFYLHYRIHCWPAKDNDYVFRTPEEIKGEHENYSDWSEILHKALTDTLQIAPDIFKDQEVMSQHGFTVGMKLEIIHPVSRTYLCPATIVDVPSEHYVIIEVDDLQITEQRLRVCRHAGSMDIFPVEWALHNGVRLVPPGGWTATDFNWEEYLLQTSSRAVPEHCFTEFPTDHKFRRGMKLEAVNPHQTDQISAATITKIVDRIMWIHLDSASKVGASFMTNVNSLELFPVGWCESNGYTLKPPKQVLSRRVAVVKPDCHLGHGLAAYDGNDNWCAKIYFNHRCFSGPFLSKGRIAELPKSVGPGPICLVLKEVLSMLINVAYKSSRVLKELQLEGEPNINMHQQSLKAKYKGKSYRATVEICRSADQLEEFCRQTCIKLECCPYLVSPLFVNGNCPENCQQLTKTKYTYYYGKKKKKNKVGRPPGGHTNLETVHRMPGRKKKKRRPHPSWLHGPKKLVTAEQEREEPAEGAGVKLDSSVDHHNEESGMERKRRKYIHHLPPPSDIQTRGAKLPRYSFERRTHKKVLIEHRSHRDDAHRKRLIRQRFQIGGAGETKESIHNHDDGSRLHLDSNPLSWSVSKVAQFIMSTDCANLARLFKEQEIDGQAFLLLNLPSLQDHMELKLGPAIKLCHQIEKVKIAFYRQFAS